MVARMLIPLLGSQRQANLCGFDASRVSRMSYSTAKATQRNTVPKKTKTNDFFIDQSVIQYCVAKFLGLYIICTFSVVLHIQSYYLVII